MRHKKIDNQFLATKLALRKYFLQKFHAKDTPFVFDACQGEGNLWRILRQEFPCRYWGVDIKKKKGRLALDSLKILSQPGWDFDIIDIDTYGFPWKHWQALLPHVHKPITVFLTYGQLTILGGRAEREIDAVMGVTFRRIALPHSLRTKLAPYATPAFFAQALRYNLTICDIRRAFPASHSVSYYGVHLAP